MTLVVPLGQSAFVFFDKDRNVIHTLAKAIKQALDLSFSIRLLPIASDFLLEGLTACGTTAGFDSLKHLGFRERLGLWDFAQQVQNRLRAPNYLTCPSSSPSARQAYCCLQQAQRTTNPLSLPEPKAVFTVKLPTTLIQRVRQIARRRRQPISDLVQTGRNW